MSNPPTESRADRLRRLREQIDQSNKANEHDVAAEGRMIASHTGTRIRRGVVEQADGSFVTDTRDLEKDEGTLEENDATVKANAPKVDDQGYDIAEEVDSAKKVTTIGGNEDDLLDDRIVAYLNTSLHEQEQDHLGGYKNKKQRHNDFSATSKSATTHKPQYDAYGFHKDDSSDGDEGNGDDIGVPGGGGEGGQQQPLGDNDYISLSTHSHPNQSGNDSKNTLFSGRIHNAAAAHEIGLQMQKKIQTNKVKGGVKKHMLGDKFTGVSFGNEGYNHQITRDYADELSKLKKRWAHSRSVEQRQNHDTFNCCVKFSPLNLQKQNWKSVGTS